MNTLLRIVAFLVGGGILVYLVLLYLSALYAAVFPGNDARQIAPIETVVEGKSSTELGPALSQMLLVHLAEIRRHLQDAAETLQPGAPPAPPAGAAGVVGPVERQPVALLQDELPNRLQESFTIQLNVGGVELTGVANWLFRQFNSPATMRIVVETVGTKRHIYGNFDPAGLQTFVIRMDENPSHDAILAAVAHRIAHRTISRSIPQLGALRDNEFKDLLRALSQLADLNRQIARGREPSKEFDEVLTLLDPLTGKVRTWAALARITGEVAERANNLPRARDLYVQAMAAATGDAERRDLQSRVTRVANAIATASAAPRVPSAAVAGAAPPTDELVKPLLRRVGIATGAMPDAIRIAIVGGAPAGVVAGVSINLVGPEAKRSASEPADDGAGNYFVSIMNTVRLVAPKTEFSFSRRSVARPSDVVEAIQDLLPQKPQVILLPIRGVEGAAIDQLLRQAADQNIVVVQSAGNEGPGKKVPFAGTDLLDRLAVISAVDNSGNPAPFSQHDSKSFWAPGVDLPAPGAEDFSKWSGTGPAAAIAAGVIARVLSEKPGVALDELLKKLREGSMPQSREAGSPKVINAEKTISLINIAAR